MYPVADGVANAVVVVVGCSSMMGALTVGGRGRGAVVVVASPLVVGVDIVGPQKTETVPY